MASRRTENAWPPEPPQEVWAELASLAERGRRWLPPEERAGLAPFDAAWCADELCDLVTEHFSDAVTFKGWNPRLAVMHGVTDPLRRAAAAADSLLLGDGDTVALAKVLGIDAGRLALQIIECAALGRRLADAAAQIAPRPESGRPPERLFRSDGSEVLTVGETLLLVLWSVVRRQGGHFTLWVRTLDGGKGSVVAGSIAEAWAKLAPYMPPGFELPTADRIKRMRSGDLVSGFLSD